MIDTLISAFRVVWLPLFLASCAASGPKTEYYTLNAMAPLASAQEAALNPALADQSHIFQQAEALRKKVVTFGVGPIQLPEYLDSSAVVSRELAKEGVPSARLIVSGRHAWRGNLQEGISRLLVQNLGSLYGVSGIWPLPANSRVAPKFQIRVAFDELAGVRGEKAVLQARWQLLNQKGDRLLLVGNETLSVKLHDDSAQAYVQGVNQSLNDFSVILAERALPILMEQLKAPRVAKKKMPLTSSRLAIPQQPVAPTLRF